MRPPLISSGLAPRTMLPRIRTLFFFRQSHPTRKRCRHCHWQQQSQQEQCSSWTAFHPIHSSGGKPPTLVPPRRIPSLRQLSIDNQFSVGAKGRRYASSSSSSSSLPQPRRRRRSPYAVLGLRKGSSAKTTTISQDDIKTAFRKLAKIYHPDLNPHNKPLEECELLMSELIEAYERLLKDDETEDDFLEHIQVGASNKVALACELYSVDELLMDRFHEVHALRIEYDESDQMAKAPVPNETTDRNTGEPKEDLADSAELFLPSADSHLAAIPFQAHPGDSVLDLKERLESEFSGAWGLEESLGWELVAFRRPSGIFTENENQNEEEEDPSTVAANNVVLSYHLFLEDYQIQHGDTIYAVVRTND